jgi:hypothetical protein
MTKRQTELEEAQRELESLMMELQRAEMRVAKQKRIVAALYELYSVEEENAPQPTGLVSGITDAVRTVFMGSASAGEKWLTVRQVAERVTALGIPPQSNLLASVHTVTKRLAAAKEIELVGDIDFGGGYRWASSREALLRRGAELAKKK